MSAIASDIYGQLGLAANSASGTDNALGQADFLRLMTEQLKNQDPLKPLENSEFLAQLAQFSTVQGIQDLNTTFNGFADTLGSDQALRAAALVGREVLVPSDTLTLSADGASGLVDAPAAGTLVIDISDSSGRLVHQIQLTAGAAGEVDFAWDGLDADGDPLPAGTYGVAARHIGASGTQSLSTYVDATVESVTLGSQGLILNLPGLGSASLANVRRIG